MLELPEAVTLAKQLNESVQGRKIKEVVAGYSPHKFAFFHGDPAEYGSRLQGKVTGPATSHGGLPEIQIEEQTLLFGDGVGVRFLQQDEKRPAKHQLLLEFEDGTALSCSVQMYGGLWCFGEGEFDSPYYAVACEKPSPLSDDFTSAYFESIVEASEVQNLSSKALLATEQRIPGLGNGVLQDILYNAKVHPKKKVSALSPDEKENIFNSVKRTLREMTEQGGRDTEKNLYGTPGGYVSKLSKNTVGQTCPECGRTIVKQAYMGGSIYFCAGCQKFP